MTSFWKWEHLLFATWFGSIFIDVSVLLCAHAIPMEWYVHMFNTANQILGCRQLAQITLVSAVVFITISCKFLLVLGLGCCCWAGGGLWWGVGRVVSAWERVGTELCPCNLKPSSPSKPHQLHLKRSSTKMRLRQKSTDNNKRVKDKKG